VVKTAETSRELLTLNVMVTTGSEHRFGLLGSDTGGQFPPVNQMDPAIEVAANNVRRNRSSGAKYDVKLKPAGGKFCDNFWNSIAYPTQRIEHT